MLTLLKNILLKSYSFLVNDITLPWDYVLGFRKNLLEWIHNKIMTIDDKTKEEKIQHDINREVSKISALWSGKINKYEYEYLMGEEILPSEQSRIKRTSQI